MSSNKKTVDRSFEDNGLAMQLFGPHHSHISLIENELDIDIHTRGNEVKITGEATAVDMAAEAMDSLYNRLGKGLEVGISEVEAVIRMAGDSIQPQSTGNSHNTDNRGNGKTMDHGIANADIAIRTQKRVITPRSTVQAEYLDAIDRSELVFGQGPAGTGKTYLAVAKAVERLLSGDVDRIILSRPAVEAGESLGFLPGDMQEKVDPYLRPLYDALHDMMPESQVAKRLERGEIEVAPIAFMRGRTLSNAFVILDEAQNTTAVQMKMFLTRLGEGSRMVITGDLSQVDLPRGTRSGLRDAWEALRDVEGIGFVTFTESDVVRHKLVGRIVRAYNAIDDQRRTGAEYETEGKG